MPLWAAILIGLALGVAAIGYRQHRARRGIYRPLATRQPQRRAAPQATLGLEATDMGVVNAAARRNESLERGHTNWTFRGGLSAATDVAPMADDETYAARFHAAFMKDKGKHR